MSIFSVPVSVHLLLIKENKILLMRRKDTGFADGFYSMPAGKLEPKESVEDAIIREVKEEINIDIKNETLKTIQVMNRNGIDRERIDYFFTVDRWNGEIKNNEPNKCDDLKWFDLDYLPENTIPYIKEAIINYNKKINFSLFGW
ncbi:MAG: NUDIX domain-containing protein [Clostridia bacterium]|nr:NUDIX domain-containing protein [Clostridia bacterium]MBP3596874.1 NUDIX domain-containing protein [Clostridia bacterium]